MLESAREANTVLNRVEQKLLSIAALSGWNASLALGDPALLLPSPAVSVMALEGEQPRIDGVAFRSLDPIGESGDVWFTPVSKDFTVQPWVVKSAEWLFRDTEPVQGPGDESNDSFLSGIRVHLTRPPGAESTPGWMNVFVIGTPLIGWGLRGTHAYFKGTRVDCRPLPDPLRDERTWDGSLRPVHQHFLSLSEDMIQIECPGDSDEADRQVTAATLELRFDQPIPARTASMRPPEVATNAILVWNSVDVRVPDPDNVEQWATGAPRRQLHPLRAGWQSKDWRAWQLQSIHEAGKSHRRAPLIPPYQTDLGHTTSPECKLCVVPDRGVSKVAKSRVREHGYVLALWFPDGGLTGAEGDGRIAIHFRTTTGAAANGIPAGTEFRIARLNGFPARENLRARLLCASWGGTHGLIPLDEDQVKPGAGPAVQLQHQSRSVGDVIALIDLLYGREMELVDPRDLLRYTDGYAIAPLQARVRFKNSKRSEWERSMILHSCERVLRGYLGGQVSGGIDLVEDRGTRR